MNLTDFGERADEIIALGEIARATSGHTEWGGSHLSPAKGTVNLSEIRAQTGAPQGRNPLECGHLLFSRDRPTGEN